MYVEMMPAREKSANLSASVGAPRSDDQPLIHLANLRGATMIDKPEVVSS